jgi:catechol 2,3-dioxygenase
VLERHPAQPYGIQAEEYRLPDPTHIGTVHLQVSDLSRSIEYYEQVIGLTGVPDDRDVTNLRTPGASRPLVTLRTRSGVTPARRGAFGLYHFAILLPDRAALGRFARHLSELRIRAGMADHLVSEALYLWDPDGLGIEVYADRPRGTWRHRNRELVMSTDPLDVEDLIAAAGGERWHGAPEGTTMGHVHLQVGNLDAADAFYHQGLGFDKTVWNYPSALFFSAGGYHHHLGANTWSPGPSAREHEARLLEWELIVPASADATNAARHLASRGYVVEQTAHGAAALDPWGTRLHIRT